MAPEIGLRRARPDDRAALAAMQADAYEPNRAIIGGTPTPLTWDYGEVLARCEVWLAADDDGLAGALILAWRLEDLFIESIAVASRAKGRGVGKKMLTFAEGRAVEGDRALLRLVANARMTFNVDWYGRNGFIVERIETIGERRRVHMAKALMANALVAKAPAAVPRQQSEEPSLWEEQTE